MSVVSMLQRTYILINQSCNPVCWSFQFVWSTHDQHQPFKQFRVQEKEDRGNSLVSEMVGLTQSEVYTHSGCIVALKGAAFDVEWCGAVDGPSLVPVFVQGVLHVQIFRAQGQLFGLEGLCCLW